MPNWSDENGRYWYTPVGAREEVEVPHPPVIVQKGCGCAFCKENRPKRHGWPTIQNVPLKSEIAQRLHEAAAKARGFAQIEPSKDLVEAELKRLRDEVDRLRRELPQYDCRRTGGPVSDVSGRHCPPDYPCVSCQLDDAAQERDEALQEALSWKQRCDELAADRERWMKDSNAEAAELVKNAEDLQAKAFDQLDDVTRERDEALAELAAMKAKEN